MAIQGLHGVRYQSKDVQRAADFYTKHLGFKLEHQHLPAFATVALATFPVIVRPGKGSRLTLP